MFVKVRCTFCVMCVTILVYTNSLLLKYFYVVILLLISNARSSTKTSILNSLGNQQTNIMILFVFKMLNTSLLNFMIIFRKRGKSKVKWIHFSILLKINSMNSALQCNLGLSDIPSPKSYTIEMHMHLAPLARGRGANMTDIVVNLPKNGFQMYEEGYYILPAIQAPFLWLDTGQM